MLANRRKFMKGAISLGVYAAIQDAMAITAAPPADLAERKEGKGGSRPNIILLFPDQWRFDWMSGRSDLPIHTPNLDRIAKRGIRFERAMVAAPVCGPSRACLASGMEYDRSPVATNQIDYQMYQPTFYKKLRNDGYEVMACGKMDLAKGSDWWGHDGKWRMQGWGFSDQINNAGKWDQLIGYELNNNVPPDPYLIFLQSRGLLQEHLADYRRRWGKSYTSTFPTPLPDDAYCDNWVTQNALNLLKQTPHDKPWFMQVNWPGPHEPVDITVRMEKSVRSRKMPPPVGPSRLSAEKNMLIRQNYTAMCENIDRGIGLILDMLEKTGQMDNTLVIFGSDHGDMLGDLNRWGKSVPYQPSAGVPLIIAGPGVKTGMTNSALVSSIDITATILDYAGATTKGIDGQSLRPVLEGQSDVHRRIFYSGLYGWRLAFDGQYKVITGFSARGGGRDFTKLTKYDPRSLAKPPMVFDLLKDPGETTDIASHMPASARTLLKGLATGDYPA